MGKDHVWSGALTKSIGMLVAGEVGPTETRLALCGLDMGRPVVVIEETTPNRGFVGLGPMVQRFLAKHRPPQIRGAAFVVSGPVSDGVCLAANLPWPVEGQALGSELGIDHVSVLNDVEATAHAIQSLGADDMLVLTGGDASEPGNQAVITVGACPGMSGLHWNGTEHRSFLSEGGHADFAPSNESELRLALHLSRHVARVTVELLLSSSGLGLIYRYLREESPTAEPPELTDAFRGEEVGAVVLRASLAGTDPVCRQALETFLSIYGSCAGNLALTLRTTGGVYLAGDILPSMRGELASSGFLSAFGKKAPMQELLGKIPVHAILNERAALLGAAAVAARELRIRRVGGWAS
jgi:glucokinase